MSRKRLGIEPSKLLAVRIPGEWYALLEAMSDARNPLHEIVRTAIKRFLRIASA